MEVIKSGGRVNEKQKSVVYDKLISIMDDVKGKTIALLGLAFKPETADTRETPALVIIEKLLKDREKVRVFAPIAVTECKRCIGDMLKIFTIVLMVLTRYC